MHKTILRSGLALALCFALVPAEASHCETYSSSYPEFTSNPTQFYDVPTFYIDNDICHMSGTCIWSIWVYEESNGIPGLQRDDEVVDNTCHDMIRGDTIVL